MAEFRTPLGPAEKLLMCLVQAQRWPVVGLLFRMGLKWKGVQIPPQTFTRCPHLAHVGTFVVHEKTRMAPSVTLFHNVTIGRADVWQEPHPDFGGCVLLEHVVVGAGAAVLSSRGTLVVAVGSVVGAGSVLTTSTGPWEIWAGSPARRVGTRERLHEPGASDSLV